MRQDIKLWTLPCARNRLSPGRGSGEFGGVFTDGKIWSAMLSWFDKSMGAAMRMSHWTDLLHWIATVDVSSSTGVQFPMNWIGRRC